MIFGRADSWLEWRSEENSDRPLLSFLNIVGIAFQGLAAVRLRESSTRCEGFAFRNRCRRLPGAPSALPSIVAAFLQYCFAAACAPSRHAQAIDANSPSLAIRTTLPLSGTSKRVMMKGSDARTTISFGVPVTKVVTQAKLAISYRASAALAPKSSTIDVSLNGTPVSSLPIAGYLQTPNPSNQRNWSYPPNCSSPTTPSRSS